MKALQRSNTIHDTIKQKVGKVLKAEYTCLQKKSIVQNTDEDPQSRVIGKVRLLNQRRYIIG